MGSGRPPGITNHPRPFALTHELSPSRASLSRQTSVARPALSASSTHENATCTGAEPVVSSDPNEQPTARHLSSAGTVGSGGTVPIGDVESQQSRSHAVHDPYNLASAFKTAAQLDEIRANTSRRRVPADESSTKRQCVPVDLGKKIRTHRVQNFYRSQNETIERLLKSAEEHRADAQASQGDERLQHQIAIYASFAANVILAILQIYGAVSSGSLSLFTTMADAIFDPMSNITLIVSNRAVRRVDASKFPSGKARLETVGNIAFCFVMTAVSFILIAFSARELVEGNTSSLKSFHLPSVIAVAIAFTTKLVLFFYCWGLKDKYSQINILWQDHRNDLLINGFGILTSVGGSKLAWWIDPMGAIILSVLVSVIWLRTAFAEFMLLVGVVASVEVQQLITYVCLTHSPSIQGIDTVRVYHSGPRLIAEVDIVMDPSASLRDTHDVAEELQFKLEGLPDIERAYVHVDYETTHKPEHFIKKEL